MKVQYIGKQKKHRDRLYGTRVQFNGPGDVQDVKDESTALKMINNHPDQYADGEHEDLTDANKQLNDSGTSLEDSLAADLGDGADTDQDTTPDADAVAPPVVTTIQLAGQEVALEDVSKDVLIDVAKRAYDSAIPVRTGKPEVINIITDLIAERGQPKGL